MTLIAVTRPVSASLAECELTHLDRVPIDLTRAAAQHAAYESLLQALGATIVRVPAAPSFPDAVFIEDTALVLDDVAVITRPGAETRRGELADVVPIVTRYRPVVSMDAPATLDGGDVVRLGRTLYVGRSSRTNDAGREELGGLLRDYGYRVVPVAFNGCLHLKSAVTAVADGVLVLNPAWVSAVAFPGYETMAIDPREPHGANALRVGKTVVYSSQYPRTRELMERRGLDVSTVDCSELAKAEGAVTCCSLVFDAVSASA